MSILLALVTKARTKVVAVIRRIRGRPGDGVELVVAHHGARRPRVRHRPHEFEGAKLAGATIHDVAKTLCFLTDIDTFATFNDAYVAGFDGSRPARSTIGVAALPAGAVVEIEAWAFKPLG